MDEAALTDTAGETDIDLGETAQAAVETMVAALRREVPPGRRAAREHDGVVVGTQLLDRSLRLFNFSVELLLIRPDFIHQSLLLGLQAFFQVPLLRIDSSLQSLI